ncbi:MAG: 3-deoxy-7-phosphoheptulonate synthase [Acidobacteria bacterium]|nr:3-deoxy-7-phosphoheptulonate synthase [Acidobacteriota bacterium]
MIIVMEQGATEEQVEQVIGKLDSLGFSVHRSTGVVHTVLGAVGPAELVDPNEFNVMEGVKQCRREMSPYKLSSRGFKPEGTVVRFKRERAGYVEIGGSEVVLMAGPSSVESEHQLTRTAELAARAGARFLRAGAHPSESALNGQRGLDAEGIKMVRRVADLFGLFVVAEISDPSRIPELEEQADLLQVSSANMQNHLLLHALGKCARPVLLKRGIAATVEELLVSADHVLAGGNYNVILCERGIRTFETFSRHTMDIAAIPAVHKLSHLPILADPSRATGRRDMAIPMARAAIAAGADGLLLEVHSDPDHAASEGAQAVRPEQFSELAAQLKLIAPAVGRSM